ALFVAPSGGGIKSPCQVMECNVGGVKGRLEIGRVGENGIRDETIGVAVRLLDLERTGQAVDAGVLDAEVAVDAGADLGRQFGPVVLMRPFHVQFGSRM